VDIVVAFLIGVLIGPWIILWALWRASMKLIEMLRDIQRSNKSTSSISKPIYIPYGDFLDLNIEEKQ
jgi:hypothetical protein